MAFEKRTWLARIGTGLNKFIIGNKDSEGKQTLTNAPDLPLTQEGDVISAENLNDLEDRIETAVNANEDEINGMELTKIWENGNPDNSFTSQSVTLEGTPSEILIAWRFRTQTQIGVEFQHIRTDETSGTADIFYSKYEISLGVSFWCRHFDLYKTDSGKITFQDSYSATASSMPQTANDHLIPVAIYKVGNIYNS